MQRAQPAAWHTPTWLLLEALGLGEAGALHAHAPRLLLMLQELLLLHHIGRQHAGLELLQRRRTCRGHTGAPLSAIPIRRAQREQESGSDGVEGTGRVKGGLASGLTLRMGRATWRTRRARGNKARGAVMRQREALSGALALHRAPASAGGAGDGTQGGQRRRAGGIYAPG